MEEAGKLAESTAILLNVSEFTDATQASEALISTMQAFQYTADESQHVVDILNEVGNNYAVSSDGIATALQDSASALMEGGNTLEQATALVAAANRVVQDPSSVGSALRTISLRLRGTSVEILEEMGEETDGVVESTSKLQAQLKALTGVNILTDTGAYKDTYTILKEIGAVWQDMESLDQAAALELMAGKNRANTLSAILNNMKDLENAYESALNAEGSSLKENAAYLDSIQGRIDLLSNAVQTMWMNFINTDVVKFLVDVATSLVKLVDTIGLVPSVVGVFTAYKVGAKELKQAFEEVSNAIVKGKEAEAVATKKAAAADIQESVASKQNANSNNQEAVASQKVTQQKAKEEVQLKKVTGVTSKKGSFTKKQTTTTAPTSRASAGLSSVVGLFAGKTGSKVVTGIKAVGSTLLKTSKAVIIAELAMFALSKVWGWIDGAMHKVENLNKEIEDLTTTYESAKKSFDDNLEILTTSSDSKTYATLQDEFDALTKGVDKYGNNLSLTSDQYERYKEICEQIVGINPLIASGYDSATEAIGNNAGVLSQLIELQKEQARIAAKEYVSDDNLKILSEGAVKDFEEANAEMGKATSSMKQNLAGFFNDILKFKDADNDNFYEDDTIEYILEKLGYDQAAINKALNEYQGHGARAGFDMSGFWSDYSDEIKKNIDKFGAEYADDLSDIFVSGEQEIKAAQNRLAKTRDGFIDELLVVPTSSEDYTKLTNESKNFLVGWIKNGDMFKVDGDLDEEKSKDLKNMILNMMYLLVDDAKNIKYNGEQITAQDLLSKIYNFDKSVSYTDYKTQINAMLQAFWNAIGGDSNKYGFKDFEGFKISLGFNFEQEDKKLALAIEQVAGFLKEDVENIQEYLEGLPTTEIQAFYSINWNEVGTDGINSWQDVLKIIREQTQAISNVASVKTYANILESIGSYNELLSKVNEIIFDNTEVTQEYKDSLIELGATNEELNEIFGDSESLVVKNSKAHKKFLSAAKKTIAADTKLAKAQAQLKYYELYKEMRNLWDGQRAMDSATLAHINSLYDEMSAVQGAIAKYSLLEAQLLGATNAYDQLAEAQQFDSDIDYGSKAEELVNVLANAFNTAELGTEAAKVAIDGLIPDDVIDKSKTLDEQMQQIYNYFTKGTVSKLFTIDFDDDHNISSVEMTKENIEGFVDQLLNTEFIDPDTGTELGKIFTGSWDEFDLNPNITSLKDFADACKITEEVAFAFLTSLEKYDISWLGGDMETLLDQLMGDNFEYQVQKTTQDLAKLRQEKAALAEDGYTKDEEKKLKEINDQLSQLDQTMSTHRENAYDTWQKYTNNEQVLNALDEISNKTQETLSKEKFAELGLDKIGLTWDGDTTVQEYYDQILAKQVELGQPTELKITLAKEYIDDELKKLEEALGRTIDIEANIKLNSDTGEWEFTGDVSGMTEEQKEQLKTLANAYGNLSTLLTPETSPVETIKTDVARAADALESIDKKTPETTSPDTQEEYTDNNQTNSAATNTERVIVENIQLPIEDFKDENVIEKPNVDEEAAKLNLALARGQYITSQHSFSDTGGSVITPGPAYVDPANMYGGNIDNIDAETKQASVNADNVEVNGDTTSDAEPKLKKVPTFQDFVNGILYGHQDLKVNEPDLTYPAMPMDNIGEAADQVEALNDDTKDVCLSAYEMWQKYTQNDAAIAALEQIEEKTEYLTKDSAIALGLEWDEVAGKTVQEVYDSLIAKQQQLATPTKITAIAELAIDDIDAQIQTLQTALNNNTWSNLDPVSVGLAVGQVPTKEEVEAKLSVLKQDMAVISTTFGIELNEEQKELVKSELESVESFEIGDKEFNVSVGGTSDTTITLQNIKQMLDNLKDKTVTVTTVHETKTKKTVETKYTSVPSDLNQYVSDRISVVDGTAHVNGTAYKGGSWGAEETETSLVGELGPEMRVRGNRWELIGQNGAEFTDVRKGDIIFNHKQTEDLLSHGYITGRGKAYAEGTVGGAAYASINTWDDAYNKVYQDYSNNKKGSSSSYSSDSVKDAADEFLEVFDWIEVRLEEINEKLSLLGAELENTVGHTAQNKVVDKMIEQNKELYYNLVAGANEYYAYAKSLLAKVPSEYRAAAKNGSIAIETFVGEVDEETLKAIQDYREWVQKGADATQQAEETLTEISSLAKQAIDNIAADYENKASLRDNKIDQYEAYNSLIETDQGFESEKIYQAMIKEANSNITTLNQQRDKMQAELNKRVEAGEIEKYSQDWYDAVNDIAAVDTAIIELKTDTEDWQDAINELHWDKLDLLIKQLESVSDEAENLIDVLSNKDVVDEAGEWTKEGITSLGLYAQQMEVAEVQAKKYKEEIQYLNKNWQKLGYTEEEYIDKLDELKSAQYDSIQAYYDARDAIVDLNAERVEAIKEGIQKEIDAYTELIEKKKEALSADKDLYDFEKSIMEQKKSISDIERQLAALSGDNSASARAKRAQLEAELTKAKADLEDSYYDRSMSNQQEALDKELEQFQDTKNKEIEGWEEYLENTELVVSDSLTTIQANTDVVYQTLKQLGSEYSLSITESLTSPWKEGENAIQSFSEKFGVSMSATVAELEELAQEFKATMLEIEQAGTEAVNNVKNNATNYQSASNPSIMPGDQDLIDESGNSGNGSSSISGGGGSSYPYGKASETSGNIKKGAKGDDVKAIQYALNKLGYGNSGTSKVDGIFGSGTRSAVKAFQSAMGISSDGIVGKDTRAKFKKKGYALGTTSVPKSDFAWVDELGEELILRPHNGRLTFLEKGTSVIPADATANLMQWSTIDPTDMLERNRPKIGMSPSVVNNTMEINVDASVGTLLAVENFNGDDPAEVAKIVNKALEQHTKNLNASLKKFVR